MKFIKDSNYIKISTIKIITQYRENTNLIHITFVNTRGVFQSLTKCNENEGKMWAPLHEGKRARLADQPQPYPGESLL